MLYFVVVRLLENEVAENKAYILNPVVGVGYIISNS